MFEQQGFLVSLVIVVPLFAAFFIWRGLVRASIMRRIGDQELVQRLTAQISPMRRRIKIILWLGAISAILVALARPVWGFDEETIRTQGLQIIFAIDISRSMDATDVSPSRLERARLDLLDLMTAFEGNDLGMILFAQEAFTYMPLTYDLRAAEVFLGEISTSMVTLQGTNIPAAIERSLGAYERRSNAQRILIIVTDGESHEGDAIAASELAADEDVVIYTIGYGTQEGSTIPLYDENGTIVGYKTLNDAAEISTLVNTTLNVDLLERIAATTDGAYLPGGGDFTALVDDIDRFEGGDIGERIIRRPIERFWIFIGLAVLLLSAEIVLPETRREVAHAA